MQNYTWSSLYPCKANHNSAPVATSTSCMPPPLGSAGATHLGPRGNAILAFTTLPGWGNLAGIFTFALEVCEGEREGYEIAN